MKLTSLSKLDNNKLEEGRKLEFTENGLAPHKNYHNQQYHQYSANNQQFDNYGNNYDNYGNNYDCQTNPTRPSQFDTTYRSSQYDTTSRQPNQNWSQNYGTNQHRSQNYGARSNVPQTKTRYPGKSLARDPAFY